MPIRCLKARGWPFTVFVSTGGSGPAPADYMTWDEMREMAKHGANFADHTVDHGHLPFRLKGETDLAWADRMRADIVQAQDASAGGTRARIPTALRNSSPIPTVNISEELAKLVNGLGYVAFGQQAGVLERTAGYPRPAAFPHR